MDLDSSLLIPTLVDQTSEPWWKSLFPTIVQTVVSLISIFVGVAIAVWSFRKKRQSEHVQWIRDQRRSEWKAILEGASRIEEAIPAISRIQERYHTVSQRLPQMLSQLLGIRGGCAFISVVLDRQETTEMFENFICSAASAAEFLQGFDARLETDPAVRESCRNKYAAIRDEYLRFCFLLKAEARKDLGIATPFS